MVCILVCIGFFGWAGGCADPGAPESAQPSFGARDMRHEGLLVSTVANSTDRVAPPRPPSPMEGARVIAVASGAHESFLRELGADQLIDYIKSRPEEFVHEVDLVLDAVGGHASSRFLRTLERGGALCPVFFGDYDDEETAKLGVTLSGAQVRSSGSQLAELGRLLDAGMLRVAIDSTFPLADATAAHERAAQGHIQGKIVLTVA